MLHPHWMTDIVLGPSFIPPASREAFKDYLDSTKEELWVREWLALPKVKQLVSDKPGI